jgi:tetratricopeptide (TPR) repeat protein
MKLNLTIVMMLSGLAGHAAVEVSEFSAGRAYYAEGDFKKAVAHFRLALKANPNDAESYYWMGMSYEVMADVAWPLDRIYKSRARDCLTKAMQLAPNRTDYRNELFEFLLESAGSRDASRQAAEILRTIPESAAEYAYTHRRFAREKGLNASAEARLGRLFLAVPRAAYRIGELPASVVSGGTEPSASGTVPR